MNQDKLTEMYLDNVWRPNLSITGAGGLPDYMKAGNVVRPSTVVRCSLRVSPDLDANEAKDKLIELLTKDPPHNSKVTVLNSFAGNGFCMGELQNWLTEAMEMAGHSFFNKEFGLYGEGGSIPFLNELSKKYPNAQIVAFGVLGP